MFSGAPLLAPPSRSVICRPGSWATKASYTVRAILSQLSLASDAGLAVFREDGRLHQRQGRGWLQEGLSAQGPGADQASWRQVLAGGFNKTTSYTGFQAANRFVIIQYPSADAWNKLWNGGLKDHQNMVGNKYADVRILSVESVEMK